SNNGWYFFGTSNLTKIPRDLSLDGVTYITRMFSECDNFNDPNVNFLDVSRVKVMPQVFMDSPKFNQPLGNWDLRNATDIRGMFNSAESFNQNINSWVLGEDATDLSDVFYRAFKFNQPLDNWDVKNIKS